MKRHIAVNTRLLIAGRIDGIARFSYEILKRVVEMQPEIQFSFLFDRKFEDEMVFGKNVTPYIVPIPSRHPALWYAGFHYFIPQLLKKIQPNLFFSPEFFLAAAPNLPQIPVFHDLDFEFRPQDVPYKTALWYYQHFFPKYAQNAAHILAVSDYTKNAIHDLYKIPLEKISVTHNACNAQFSSISEVEKREIRQKFTNGNPFFHFVGTIQPRKNIENLLIAFDRFKKIYPSNIQLLLVGKQGWNNESAMKTFEKMEFKDAVKFTGFVSDANLGKIHASSIALCIVSFLEGFGIPAVEAMFAETAILASNRAALPEVCGDAAIFINPDSPESICEALLKLAREEDFRKELILKGKIQRENFSWDKSAQKVATILDSFD
jgi:glycosyltransferase involved in cell wall biosynthesis